MPLIEHFFALILPHKVLYIYTFLWNSNALLGVLICIYYYKVITWLRGRVHTFSHIISNRVMTIIFHTLVHS